MTSAPVPTPSSGRPADDHDERPSARFTAGWLDLVTRPPSTARACVVSIVIVAACTALAAAMQPHFERSNLTMVYLLGVVVSAIALGRGPAIVTSVLSVAMFNFTFVPPRFTLRVADTQYLVTFAVMLTVAVVIGTLTAWLRDQLEQTRRRERRMEAMYRLSRDLAVAESEAAVIEATRHRIAGLLDADVAVHVNGADRAPAPLPGDPESGAAAAVLACGRSAGAGTRHVPEVRGLHVPLAVAGRRLGVLSVRPRTHSDPRDPDRVPLLEALAGQAALALERCRLSREAQLERTRAEAERARNALLSSVSHDLRTPLAAITGAATNLRDDAGALSEPTRRELAETIADEAQRLNRLIGDLLEMTRLESGAIRARREWHSLEEIVGAALGRLEPQIGDRPVRVSIPDDLPLVPLDDVMFELVVHNLVENADRYSPAGAAIEVEATVEAGALRMSVADRGTGLSPGEERRVFEKFYRGSAAGRRPGTGLGLAICRAIVEAHDGRIAASCREGGGAVFTVWVPIAGEPPRVEAEPSEPGAVRQA